MDKLLNIANGVMRSFVSIVVLFTLTKLLGKKQISQLNFFDYTIGISIGSIAAQMAGDLDVPFFDPLIAMVVYTIVAFLISLATRKTMFLRRLFAGTPEILLQNGKLLEKNLKRVKFDINDLLGECRNQGYFNLADLDFIIMETNGKLSFIPKSGIRPLTPNDMGISPPQEGISAALIIDGKLMQNNIKMSGRTEEWIYQQLEKQSIKGPEKVLLGSLDSQGNFMTFLKNEKGKEDNPLE